MGIVQFITPVVLLLWRRYKDAILSHWGIDFVRNMFLASTIVVMSMLAWLFIRIYSVKDASTVSIKKKNDKNEEVTEEVTTQQYDLSELKKLLFKSVMAAVVGVFLDYKFGIIQPLVIQSLMLPAGVLDSALVKIHIFGYGAVGSLKRPFKENNPLKAFLEKSKPERTPSRSGSMTTGSLGRRSSGGTPSRNVVISRSTSGKFRSLGPRSLSRRGSFSAAAQND